MMFAFIFYVGKFLFLLSDFLEDAISLLLTFLFDLFDSAFLHFAPVNSCPSFLFKHGFMSLLLFHKWSNSYPLNSHFILLTDLSHHIVTTKSILTYISLGSIYSPEMLLLTYLVPDLPECQLIWTFVSQPLEILLRFLSVLHIYTP